jgi:hypothetical protein
MDWIEVHEAKGRLLSTINDRAEINAWIAADFLVDFANEGRPASLTCATRFARRYKHYNELRRWAFDFLFVKEK